MIKSIKCKFGFHEWEYYIAPISLISYIPHKPERNIRRCKCCKKKEVSIGGDWILTNKTEDWERRNDIIDKLLNNDE
jgi:hypothetical protein